MGNNDARPADASGCLRYNTETKQFEGYGEGSWGGLGGVISLNMETKITAEDAGGLTFFTNGQKRMNIADRATSTSKKRPFEIYENGNNVNYDNSNSNVNADDSDSESSSDSDVEAFG